jgi:hypothetical protein
MKYIPLYSQLALLVRIESERLRKFVTWVRAVKKILSCHPEGQC